MKIYISGKITGLPDENVYCKFYESSERLKKFGHEVMSPAVNLLNQGFSHEDYMHVSFAMMDVCDAVFMQKDWKDSRGARSELLYALSRGMLIFWEDYSTINVDLW